MGAILKFIVNSGQEVVFRILKVQGSNFVMQKMTADIIKIQLAALRKH